MTSDSCRKRHKSTYGVTPYLRKTDLLGSMRGFVKLNLSGLLIVLLLASCVTTFQAGTSEGYAGSTPESKVYAHFLAATVYERRGQFERAAEELEKAITVAPQDIELRIALVKVYVQMSDVDKALRVCQEAVRQAPGEPMLWIWTAAICQRMERYDEAVAAYQRLVELQPGDPFWYDRLVDTAEKANDLVTLVDVFERLVELLPDSAQFRFQLGYYLTRLGDAQKACGYIEDAIRLDPNLPLARNILGLIYLDLGRDQEAVEQFILHCAQNPEDKLAFRNLAAAYARQNDFQKALEALNRAGGEQPFGDALDNLFRWYLLLRLERYEELLKAPEDTNLVVLRQVFQGIGRNGLHLPQTDPPVVLDEINTDFQRETSDFLERMVVLLGKEVTAKFLLEKFQQLQATEFPDSKRLATLIARMLTLLGLDNEAQAVLEKALADLGPDKWLYLDLASIHERKKDIEKVVRYLHSCLETDPEDPEVMNFLGYFYAENNMCLDEAEALLKRALEIQPDNGYYLDSLGWVYFRRGDADKAIEYIRRAIVKMDNDDAVLRDHLGDAYALKQDYQKAVAEWKRALRLNPTLEGVQEKLDRALRKGK